MTDDRRAIPDRIRRAAREIEQAVAAVPAGRAGERPSGGEWSARETLIHLRNVVVLVHGLRLRRLVYEPDPVFGDFDEEAFRREHLAGPEPVADLVASIVAEHGQVARLLDALAGDRWERRGRHPQLGEMSLGFLARRIAEHAEEHAGQIREIARRLA